MESLCKSLKYVISIVIFTMFILTTNFVLATDAKIKINKETISVNTQIECDKTQVNSSEEIELRINLKSDKKTKDYINVYKAKIEYDKNVFEELTENDFFVCNSWTNLEYNPKNGEFVTINFNNISEEENVVKIKLKAKNKLDNITETNIKIYGLEVGNWNDKDIVVYTVDGEKVEDILLNINKEVNKLDDKEENNEQDNQENKTDNNIDREEMNKSENNEQNNKVYKTDSEKENKPNNIDKVEENKPDNNEQENKEQNNTYNNQYNKTESKQEIKNGQDNIKAGVIPNLGTDNKQSIILKILLGISSLLVIITGIINFKKIKSKTFIVLLAIILSITISSNSSVEATYKSVDIDNNGKVDIEDIIMLEKHLIKSITIEALEIADIDKDGKVSINDLSILVHGLNNSKDDENSKPDDTENNTSKEENNTGNNDKPEIIEMTNTKTAWEAVKEMKIGWNLGNTLDSCNYQKMYIGEEKAISYYETVWGNPITTKEMIHEIKKAGFESVRLPVTYYDHIKQDGTIDEKWFERVKEVVGYILDNDMYCVLDVHHDTGLYPGGSWIVTDADKYEENAKKLSNLWTQIAEEFKDYDYKLLFEGFNEIVDTNKNYDWVTGYQNTINVNKLNQVFVDTVRKTGGKNKDRFLVVTTFGGITDEQKLSTFIMPKDSAENKIILALHDYTSTENGIDTFMGRIKKYCTDKDIPVILDEFGTMANSLSEDQRAKIASYYVSRAKDIGVTCFWWDNGNSNEYMIFNRRNLSWQYPKIKDALIDCAK